MEKFSHIFAATSFAEGIEELKENLKKEPSMEGLPKLSEEVTTTEIVDTPDNEALKKYGSKKWHGIISERIENVGENKAEGFQIVGKAARRAKAELGLKGKRGLNIYFVHGQAK